MFQNKEKMKKVLELFKNDRFFASLMLVIMPISMAAMTYCVFYFVVNRMLQISEITNMFNNTNPIIIMMITVCIYQLISLIIIIRDVRKS